MQNWVYILLCCNGRYYIGSTIDLNRRLQQHSEGLVQATRNLRPFELVFSQSYSTIKEARQVEYWLKKLKSKVIVEKIIRDGFITKKLNH